ncbi:MAG: N-acetylmuramoyl-L-alanine amidase-like domain-containing protein [Gemmatimonadales bacterium]
MLEPNTSLSRRDLLRNVASAVAALALPQPLTAGVRSAGDPDRERLNDWTAALRAAGQSARGASLGSDAIRVGELAQGTPYRPHTLEGYLHAGGSPAGREPLTLSLTRFDCVTLVEACLAVARVADGQGTPTWERFGREIERMRYRGGERRGYASRLHYFSEWISDGEKRGLVRDLGGELGGVLDERPLRFMTEHRGSYPALSDDGVFRQMAEVERRLGCSPRRLVARRQIPQVANRIETGDVLGFATSIPGLDVTHAAFAYRDPEDTLRVLHAPLSGGVVEITRSTLPEYVAAIKGATGILVARPAGG